MRVRGPLAVVFAVAVVARIGAQLVLGAFGHPITWEYEDIASSLLNGGGYTYRVGGTPYVAAVSSPLYVLLTAGVYLLTAHSQTTLLVMQALFGGATAVLAGWLAAKAFSPQAVWPAGLLVALDPGLVVYASELHPLSLDALAFMGVMCATAALPNRPGWQAAARVGVLVGLSALTRTTVLALLPGVLVWAARMRNMRLRSAAALAMVGAALVVYSPWPIRNSVLLGQFVPGSSESTEWLWRGTNPWATGSSYTLDGRTMLAAAPPEFQARVGQASESERIAIYRDAAVQFVTSHPIDAARLYLAKVKAFWWGSDATGMLYPPLWTIVYDAWYAAILLLATIGFVCALRTPGTRGIAIFIAASLVLISATQALFYVEGRHRLAVEPLLLVLAGIGLTWIASALTLQAWFVRPRPRSPSATYDLS